MKILLIAGHGAGDPGATAKIDGKTYKEAELTREVVKNLKPKLEAYGAKVAVYPTTRNAYPDSQSGTLQANADFKAADYILEIHFNAGRSDLKGDGKVAGDECYWPSRGKATGLEKPMTSRLFQGYAQRQSKSGAFSVINTSATHGKKANLLEVCFIDDADDMRIYLKSKDNVAQNIADGVAEYFNLKKEDEPMFSDIKDNKYRADIEWAAKMGIVTGYSDGTFRPDNKITRAKCMRYLHKLYKIIKEGK